jgi:hypothetical protein
MHVNPSIATLLQGLNNPSLPGIDLSLDRMWQLLAALGNPLELARNKLARVQIAPKPLILITHSDLARDEHPVVLANNFRQAIANRF